MTIDPGVLREAISHVVFAAATDDSRPVLAGVQLDVRDGVIALGGGRLPHVATQRRSQRGTQ